MRADLRAFLEHDDFEFFVDLLETDRRSEAGNAAPDDHDIARHGFAFAHDL